MKVLKNHNTGFTFIEVVLALFMIGGLLNSILLLQSSIFRNLGSYSNSLQRIFMLKERLFDAYFARTQAKEPPTTGKPEKKEIERPPTTMLYELKKINSKSSLSNFTNIVIEQATAQWKELGINRDISLLTFIYQPPKKEA